MTQLRPDTAKKKKTPNPPEEVVQWSTGVGEGLSYGHGHGVIHAGMPPAPAFFMSPALFLLPLSPSLFISGDAST